MGLLTVRAHQDLLVPDDATLPRARTLAGVVLACAAPIAGHRSELGERLLVVADVAGVRDGVPHRPSHDTRLVDDERPALRGPEPLVEDAVRACDVTVRPEVGEQRVAEAVPLGKHTQRRD